MCLIHCFALFVIVAAGTYLVCHIARTALKRHAAINA